MDRSLAPSPPSRTRSARAGLLLLGLAFALGIGLGLALPSGRVARACSCATPPPPAQALAAAGMVFDGTVTRIAERDPGQPFSDLDVSFVVHTQWKGVDSGRLTLTTADNSAMCGVGFVLGWRYIVYAQAPAPGGGQGSVSLCSRTRGYDAAEAAALGPATPPPGAVPDFVWSKNPPPSGCPRCAAPLPPREALAAAAAVFHGRVIGIEYLGPDGGFEHVLIFRNLGWWKGADAATVEVRLPWNLWYCDNAQWKAIAERRDWVEYLVYAGADAAGRLALALCGPTKPYDAAEAAQLGPATPPPADQPTGTPSPAGTATTPPFATPTATPGASPTPAACPTLVCPPCAGPRPAAEWLEEADAVFHGRVTGLEALGCDHRVQFQVDEVWKGPNLARQSVFVNMLSWQCTRRYALNEEHVVFARMDASGGLFVPVCFGIVDGDAREQLGPGTPVPAPPVTPLPPVAQLGGRIAAIAADPGRPDLVWMAQGHRVQAVDLADPANPRPLGPGLRLAGPIWGLAVDPPLGVAGVGDRLVSLDLSDPAAPAWRRDFDLAGLGPERGPLALQGRLAVVGHDGPGIAADVALLDLLDGRRADRGLEGSHDRLGDLVLVGGRLAVALPPEQGVAGQGLLQFYALPASLDDPSAGLRWLGELADPAVDQLAAVQVGGEERVYTLGEAGIVGWAVADPVQPREVARWGSEWRPEGFDPRYGDIAVTASGTVHASLHRWVGSFYTAGEVLRVLESPNAIGRWAESVVQTIRPLDAKLAASGERLFLAEAGGLGLYDAAAGRHQVLRLVVDAVDLAIGEDAQGATLLVASDQASLTGFGLGDPAAPAQRWSLAGAAERERMVTGGGLASMADYGATDIRNQSIDLVDFAGGSASGVAGRLELHGAGPGLRFDQSGRRLVLRRGTGAVALYELGDPAAPVARGEVAIDGYVSDLAVDGDRVAVVHYNLPNPRPQDPVELWLTTLAIEGAGDTLRLARRGTARVEAHAVFEDYRHARVAIGGEVAWLIGPIHCPGNPRFVLYGMDIADLGAPARVPWGWEDVGYPNDLVAAEGHLFMPGARTWMMDVRNPRLPAWAGRLDAPENADAVAVHGRTVYLAAGAEGVFVYRPSLAWASDPSIPTPTPEVLPSSLPPTLTPDCRPTAQPTPSATPTPERSPTPGMTCTPPPCPTGCPGGTRYVGDCPNIRCICVPLSETPEPTGRAWMPWLGKE